MMTEFDDLEARLRGLGSTPLDPAVASQHLTAMAAVTRPVVARSRFGRAKVAAAFAAGLVLGGTSLASAGVMGSTAQDAVADAAAKINVNLPGGTERSTDGCGGMTVKNHGDFVRQGGDPQSNCGKPVKAVENKANAGPDAEGEGDDNPGCTPPWAGKGLTKEQRAAAKQNADAWRASVAAQCPGDAAELESDSESEPESEDEGESEDKGKKPETTGTVSPSNSEVTPPSAPDDDAGVPSGGEVPAPQSEADDHRPEETPGPTVTAPPADENRATTVTVGQP